MPADPIGPHMTATPDGDDWIVRTKGGDTLGRVAWCDRWNRYEIHLSPGEEYSAACARDVADFCDRVTAARKAGGGA